MASGLIFHTTHHTELIPNTYFEPLHATSRETTGMREAHTGRRVRYNQQIYLTISQNSMVSLLGP